MTETELVEQGREAASAGDWPRAYGLLVRADEQTRLTVDDLGLLAEAAYAAGHLEATIEAWERAHAEAVRADDSLAAAGAASRVALHLMMDTALMAPIRGWVKRAERLLEGHDETPVHALLAVIRSYERLMMGDVRAAGEWAGRAIATGSECNPAAAALGRVAQAHAVILAGEVRRGLDGRQPPGPRLAVGAIREDEERPQEVPPLREDREDRAASCEGESSGLAGADTSILP